MDRLRRSFCAGALAGSAVLLLNGKMAARAHAADPAPGGERVIAIVAQKFHYTPDQITVRQGERIVLEFSSVDFVHGFSVPDLHLRADLMPGRVIRVPFPTDKPGVYDFLCDNFCGSGHEEMNGRIVVSA